VPGKSEFAVRVLAPPQKRSRFGRFGEMAKTMRPTKAEPLRIAEIRPEPRGVILYRRGVSFPKDEWEMLERRAWPEGKDGVRGSVHERILYRALVERNVYFTFQPSVEGGRLELGGLVADFILPHRGRWPGTVVPVNGSIWHTGKFAVVRDQQNEARLKALGFYVEPIWDWEIEEEYIFDDWLIRTIDFSPIF
jgi:hypothetical protein